MKRREPAVLLVIVALCYRLLFVHALVLMLGGHYTYAKVPLGFWVQDALHLGRNHYDRVGHFAQGFVPTVIAREILLRRSPLKPGRWLFFLVVCVCLAVSLQLQANFNPAVSLQSREDPRSRRS